MARTTAHYRAQLGLRPEWSKWLFEILAIPILPAFLIWAWLSGLFKTQAQSQSAGGVQLVFSDRFKVNPEIFCMPEDLAKEGFAPRRLKRGFLFGRDVRSIFQLFSSAIYLGTPFPAQLALKCAVDLSKVRGALDGLSPKWVVVYWEFSCAVTFIAWTLKRDGIATYNVMHGDKNFFAKNAFFEVTRCYCWHSHYIDLFKREHVRSDFRTFSNPTFCLSPAEIACSKEKTSTEVGVITPALATLSTKPQDAVRIMQTLARACNAISTEYDVNVRPHPLYREDFRILRPELNDRVQTTAIDKETPRAFILRNAVLIGTNSTMLLEAAYLGRKVILLETPVTAKMEAGHYIYHQPNVFRCAIEDLKATVATALKLPAPLQFQPLKKADTDHNSFGVERTFTHLSQSM